MSKADRETMMTAASLTKELVINVLVGLGYDVWVEYSSFPQEEAVSTTEVSIKALKDGRSLEQGEDAQIDIGISAYVCDNETVAETEGRAFRALADMLSYAAGKNLGYVAGEDNDGDV